MATNTLYLIRMFVMGYVLYVSFGVDAQSHISQLDPVAQRLFDYGSVLVRQNKLSEGIASLKQASAKGHGQASFELASLYEVGLVAEPDFRLAKQYYETSIRSGHRDAHFNLALLLSSPMTPNHDLKRAREVVAVIAKKGDVEAQYLLATLMKTKLHNVDVKPDSAFYWIKQAANGGYGKAQYQLAVHYLKGDQVSRSVKIALKWFNLAALQGISEAHYNLAVMHEKGEGLSVSMSKAINWYQSAADLGSTIAQQSLGIKYLLGDDVALMPKKAIQLLTSAASSGLVSAQVLLGRLYQAGYKKHVTVDLLNAETWYLKAARQGESEAQYQLALLLLGKQGGIKGAKFWLGRAADAGHIKASQLQAGL